MSDDWNDGYIVEGCDRLHVVECIIEQHIISHPAIIKAGAKAKIDAAQTLLTEAYQMVGALDNE